MKKIFKWGCGIIIVAIAGTISLMLVFLLAVFRTNNEKQNYEVDQSEIFNSAEKIEKLTGIQLPEFDVIEYKAGPRDFLGDGTDTLVINFRSVNTDSIAMILNQYDYLQKTDSKRYDYYSKEKDYAVFFVLKERNEGEIVYFTW